MKEQKVRATEQDVHKAIKTIAQECKNPYALTYVKAAIMLDMTGEELRVQCLYILSNLTHWRGETARQVKEVLMGFTG